MGILPEFINRSSEWMRNVFSPYVGAGVPQKKIVGMADFVQPEVDYFATEWIDKGKHEFVGGNLAWANAGPQIVQTGIVAEDDEWIKPMGIYFGYGPAVTAVAPTFGFHDPITGLFFTTSQSGTNGDNNCDWSRGGATVQSHLDWFVPPSKEMAFNYDDDTVGAGSQWAIYYVRMKVGEYGVRP